MRIKNKKAIEMSFDWIFALIVGGVILFLAIYFVYKISPVITYGTNTEAAADLSKEFDPFETGSSFASGGLIEFRNPAKIYLSCNNNLNAPFGEESFSFSSKKDNTKGVNILLNNKYVFSDSLIEAKEINIFSLPFYMPFKIGDIIVLPSQDYCLVNPPNIVNDTITSLGLKKVNITDNINKCNKQIIVCFGTLNNKCNVIVEGTCIDGSCGDLYESGTVKKNNTKVYYAGNLIYGAIFSNPEIYECNIKRIKARFNELSKVYLGKLQIIEKNGCGSIIQSDLQLMINKNVSYSGDIIGLYNNAKSVNIQNEATQPECKLY